VFHVGQFSFVFYHVPLHAALGLERGRAGLVGGQATCGETKEEVEAEWCQHTAVLDVVGIG
jgi:hypothetical protein